VLDSTYVLFPDFFLSGRHHERMLVEVVGLAGRGAYVDAIFLKGIALILVHQFPGIFFQCWFDDIFLVVWWVIDHHSRSQGGSLVLLSRGGE